MGVIAQLREGPDRAGRHTHGKLFGPRSRRIEMWDLARMAEEISHTDRDRPPVGHSRLRPLVRP